MQAHQLLASKKRSRRIGRGGKRGSFSGRGIKGQKSRAGRRIRPQVRDILKKIHKRRGYGRNRGRSVITETKSIQIINIADINKIFKEGECVTSNKIIEYGLATKGKIIKILGGSNMTKKLTFDKGLSMSSALRKKLEINKNNV
ncbi:MAG: uL15 family ribosomal protein [Patescibacteria group bacterium]